MAEQAGASNALRIAKKELRVRMRRLLSSISNDSIISQSGEACHQLLSLPEYKKASRISIYLSMPKSEISTRAIVLDALQEGKKVFVPYTYAASSPAANGPKSVMNMLSLQSKEDYDSLRSDAWGIPTPSKETISERDSCLRDDEIKSGNPIREKTAKEGLHMVIMPGMAFDRGLARLGHGKGYYDFFLHKLHQQEAETKMPFLVGLALKEQLLLNEQDIPTDTSDWPLDALIVGDGSVLRR